MASYELQRVLPMNFNPPRVRGLGVAPGPRPIISGQVPAYPILLPTLDQFTASHASNRRVRMIPSFMPRGKAVQGARIFPSSAAGVMPKGSAFTGLSAYMDSPTPWPLTATWGVGAYRPRSLAGLSACGCPPGQGTCSCGMGDLDLGQITLPVVGAVDLKTALLTVGIAYLGFKVFKIGSRGYSRVSGFMGARRRKAAKRVALQRELASL